MLRSLECTHGVRFGGCFFNSRSHAQFVWPQIQGFRELLQYAGFAWVIETDLASEEETTGYWENAAPIWEVRWAGDSLSDCGASRPSDIEQKVVLLSVRSGLINCDVGARQRNGLLPLTEPP